MNKKTVWEVFSPDIERLGHKELKQKADFLGLSYDFVRRVSLGERVFSEDMIKNIAGKLKYKEDQLLQLLVTGEKERANPEFKPLWSKIQAKIEGERQGPKPSLGTIEEPPDKYKTIPVFDHVRGGNGDNGWSEEHIVGYIDITADQAAMSAFSAVVQGKSMESTLPEGCVVLFRPPEEDEKVEDGTICAVRVEGWAEASIKEIYRDPSGKIILKSINTTFAPIAIDPRELTVLGVLIEARIKFNKR